MADYNIYIHSVDQSNGNGSFTTPWTEEQKESSPTNAWKTFTESASKVKKNVLDNPASLLNKGMNVLAKAVPEIAIAFAIIKGTEMAVKLADTTISTVLPFYEAETGDYMYGMNYHNIKNGVSMIAHPFSSGINVLRTFQEQRLENQRRAMKRELLGDSIINTYTNRGV